MSTKERPPGSADERDEGPEDSNDFKVTPGQNLFESHEAARRYRLAIDRWDRALWMNSKLTTADRSIALLALHQFTNRREHRKSEQLVFWPSQNTLAKILARHRDTVGVSLRKLVKAGAIELVCVGGKGRGSSRYRFCESWLRATESQLVKDGRIDLWPDDRIPRPEKRSPRTTQSQYGETTVLDTVKPPC